jgi:hypothetical protein
MSGLISNTGAVLGVDIGWAPKDSTTGACRLDWTSTAVNLVCSRAPLGARRDLLCDFADRELLVAALDGPLRGDLAIIGHYRSAEQLLTERLGQRIGKPAVKLTRGETSELPRERVRCDSSRNTESERRSPRSRDP